MRVEHRSVWQLRPHGLKKCGIPTLRPKVVKLQETSFEAGLFEAGLESAMWLQARRVCSLIAVAWLLLDVSHAYAMREPLPAVMLSRRRIHRGFRTSLQLRGGDRAEAPETDSATGPDDNGKFRGSFSNVSRDDTTGAELGTATQGFPKLTANYGEVLEIESACMACYGRGLTKLMPTEIPRFGRVVVTSFECGACNASNSEVQSVSDIQPRGARHILSVASARDLSRQILKARFATLSIPHLQFEIPPTAQQATSPYHPKNLATRPTPRLHLPALTHPSRRRAGEAIHARRLPHHRSGRPRPPPAGAARGRPRGGRQAAPLPRSPKRSAAR